VGKADQGSEREKKSRKKIQKWKKSTNISKKTEKGERIKRVMMEG